MRDDLQASAAPSGTRRYSADMPRLTRGAGLLGALLLLAACASPASSPASSPADPVASPLASTWTGPSCATSAEPSTDTISTWSASTGATTLTPVLVSNYISCGQARILFLFVDKTNRDVSAPDRTASVAFYDLGTDATTPAAGADGEFIWTIQDERGMYIANVTLPQAGVWGVEFTTEAPGSAAETTRLVFEVHDDSPWVTVGEHAPASNSPTAADVGGVLSLVTTDTDPDPDFYTTSVAAALAAHQPFFLVFATPKFCATAQCGPTLDRLKPVAAANPDVTFINVEPYLLEEGEVAGSLVPKLDADGNLQAAQTTTEWGLYFEPWMFAVDREGIVRGSFEVAISDRELTEILKVIAGA